MSKLSAIENFDAPREWHVAELRQFLDLITYGFTNPMPTTAQGPWKITAADVQEGRIQYDNARHTSPEAFSSQLTDKSRPRLQDVLLTKDGSIGRVAVVDRIPLCINQSVALLRPNERILPQFLKYLLMAPVYQQKMAADADGSTILHIYITRVDKMLVAIPPLAEQREIVNLLSLLDNKIDLNKDVNRTLEAIASIVFKSWFIDFDPARAKVQGSKPTAMPAELINQFPDKFTNSPAGLVPRGWDCKPLTEAFEVNPTRPLEKGVLAHYVDMASVPTNSARVSANIKREFTSGMRFMNGDTLVARITPCLENGKTTFIDFGESGEIAWGSTEFIVLRPKQPLPPEYGYFLARSDEFRAFAISNMSGSSGRQRVPTDCLQKFHIAVPPEPLARAFGNMAKLFFAKMKHNDEESRSLSELRDTLLPRLISGELRLQGR